MVGFTPADGEPIERSNTLRRFVGGAESNVVIGVAKLGHTAGWISRVGDDVFGSIILDELKQHGVDTSKVGVSREEPTGIYFKDRSATTDRRVVYYRKGSAMSCIKPEHVDVEYIRNARILHITGITLALSESARRTVHKAIDIARNAGVAIAFDPNYRPALWSEREAKAAFRGVLPFVDILITTVEEAPLITRSAAQGSWQDILASLRTTGPRAVYLKLGAEGAAYSVYGSVGMVPAVPIEKVVDTVGAGDAFAAGVLVGHLEGLAPKTIVSLANAMGGAATTALGDTDGVPDRAGIEAMVQAAYGIVIGPK